MLYSYYLSFVPAYSKSTNYPISQSQIQIHRHTHGPVILGCCWQLLLAPLRRALHRLAVPPAAGLAGQPHALPAPVAQCPAALHASWHQQCQRQQQGIRKSSSRRALAHAMHTVCAHKPPPGPQLRPALARSGKRCSGRLCCNRASPTRIECSVSKWCRWAP